MRSTDVGRNVLALPAHQASVRVRVRAKNRDARRRTMLKNSRSTGGSVDGKYMATVVIARDRSSNDRQSRVKVQLIRLESPWCTYSRSGFAASDSPSRIARADICSACGLWEAGIDGIPFPWGQVVSDFLEPLGPFGSSVSLPCRARFLGQTN